MDPIIQSNIDSIEPFIPDPMNNNGDTNQYLLNAKFLGNEGNMTMGENVH